VNKDLEVHFNNGYLQGYNQAVEDAANLVSEAKLTVHKNDQGELIEDVTSTFARFIAESIRRQLRRKQTNE
jgi:hypothetical protein